jgi:hypothetical protein
MRLEKAIQEHSFPFFNRSKNRIPSALVNGKNCEGGIVTRSRSNLVFHSKERPLEFDFFVGLSDQNIWYGVENSMKVSYRLKVNNNEVWSAENISRESVPASGKILIPAGSSVELITKRNKKKPINSIWCVLKVTSLK